MIVHPYGVVFSHGLELGLEVEVEGNRVVRLGPHTGLPEPYILSPAFVNAHSHMEYRGLQDRVEESEYWPWIRRITVLKTSQSAEQVAADCRIAAQENRRAGIALIGEHSDRPGSAAAMREFGLQGVLFRELITFFEHENPETKWRAIESRRQDDPAGNGIEEGLAPHSAYTVDPGSLAKVAQCHEPISIHVAETADERRLFADHEGPIAEFFRSNGVPLPRSARSSVAYLEELGLCKPGVQFVHCCDLDDEDIATLAAHHVSVAHCPRSNRALNCPQAPIRKLLDSGVQVGLGLDSAASSGPIDMFTEMRATRDAARQTHGLLASNEIWNMATTMGAATLGHQNWRILEGGGTPLIKIHAPYRDHLDDIIEHATPEDIEWLARPIATT